MTVLDRALAALDGGDHDGAVALLLDAWRASRAPAIADVLDGLSRALRARVKGIEAKTASARARQFDALVASGGPTVVEFLLDGIGNEKIEEARRRVEALRAFAPDPRLSRGLLELTARLPFSALSAMPFWTLVSDVIATCADPRAEHAIGELRATLLPLVGGDRADKIVAKLRKVSSAIARQGQPRPLDPDAAATVAAIGTRVSAIGGARLSGGSDGEALLEAIYETPEADEPRQVYADWLLERGDPRGEFIALQLQRARTGAPPSLRERKLLGTWGKAWLGPLGRGRILDERRTRFERGFFVAGMVLARGVDTVHGHREWATCEELDVGLLASSPSVLSALLHHPCMRAVQKLYRLPTATVWEVAERPLRRPLVEIGLAEVPSRADLRRLGRREGLPALRRLRLPLPPSGSADELIDDALELLPARDFELITFSSGSDRFEVRRDGAGTRIEVVLPYRVLTASEGAALEELRRSPLLPQPVVLQLPEGVSLSR